MKKDQIFVVGVDVSKASFDVYFLDAAGKKHWLKLENGQQGFQTLLSSLPKEKNIKVVMEASGPYYYQLACFLFDQGIEVAVMNPLVIKRFCQMQLQRTKTDKADARAIFEYGSLMQTKSWQPLKECYLKIKQLYSRQKQLLKHQHATERQLEAFLATAQVDECLKQQMQQDLAQIRKMIQAIDDQLQELIAQQDSALKEQLESIPGIGPKASLLLIVCLRGFEGFDNYRQVISYVGLSPRIYESGSSVKAKARICKMGMGQLRACLYMAAISAKRANGACKQLYERLRSKGKAHKQAMIAVVNKLLKQAFALVQSGELYNPEYALINTKTK
ncbi:MAG: IS110 family transposase [Bacteroidetes bacterium]|nr:IS110 family transposase [Bacteroidota bacterium]